MRMREWRNKGERVPEKFYRKMVERMKLAAMGRDTDVFHTPLFRQIVGSMYGMSLEESTAKRLKETRTIDEWIWLYNNSAKAILGKRLSSEAEISLALDEQMSLFVRFMYDTLRTMPTASSSVLDQLQEYQSTSARTSMDATETTPTSAATSSYVQAVAALFTTSMDQVVLDIQSIQSTCTIEAACQDLKRCVYYVHTQHPWPGCAADFLSDEAYQTWRKSTLASLAQQMSMLEATHALPPRPSGTNPFASSIDVQDVSKDATDDEFTFIPPDPNAAYFRLAQRCLDKDLETIRQKSAEEEVLLSIFSAKHVELLRICSQMWNISPAFSALATMRLFKSKFDAGEIPFACLPEAWNDVAQVLQLSSPTQWRTPERTLLTKVTDGLAETLLRLVYSVYSTDEATSDEARPALSLLAKVEAVPLPERPDWVVTRSKSWLEAVHTLAHQRYATQVQALWGSKPLVNTFSALLTWLEHQHQHWYMCLPLPVLGAPVCDQIDQHLFPMYVADLAAAHKVMWRQVQAQQDADSINEALSLWKRLQPYMSRYNLDAAFLRSCFQPYVEAWMAWSEQKTSTWIHTALENDTFQPMSHDVAHSASIHDVAQAWQQSVSWLQALAWPDAYEQALFYAALTRSIGRLLEQYCRELEAIYMSDMTQSPLPTASSTSSQTSSSLASVALASLPAKHAAWVAKAQQSLQGEKPAPPFVLQPYSCIKLNNLETARHALDALYQAMDADQQAAIVQQFHAKRTANSREAEVAASAASAHAVEAASPRKPTSAPRATPTYSFGVKIVQAELAATPEALRLDTFVTISDEQGQRLAKTRTIFDTLSPRWDEVIDVACSHAQWISITVWQRTFEHEPMLYGRSSLHLNPRAFQEHKTRDVWLDLDGHHGQVALRVSLEESHDGILYYFGRAFRVLKRTETDMVRVLVDHMSLVMRQYLSRSVLKSLVRGGRVDRVVGNMRALYASAMAQAQAHGAMPSIPPVDMPKKGSLSDQEMEAVLNPLLDYFDDTLGTLKSSLSDTQLQFVLTRVWKEVLRTLESLLVPPLSDAPCDMRQLLDKEVDIVFKWLSFLRSYFNAYDPETGMAHGIPLDILQGPQYRELLSYLLLHDQSTDALMVECVRGFQARLASSQLPRRARAKSVLTQRSLGTIKQHKRDKVTEDDQSLMTDMAMKILRMRPGTGDFLAQQLISLHALQAPVRQRTSTPSRRVSMRLEALFRG
ncbi:cytoplasm protein [Malassezia pachydermatis]|uniref:Cytoplasm protein n=1 Tax=Malassezia pachydermatis TaxID=77020 RepID=A0A0M8MT10_9BASI|nr:cytoplasm protein [Malassezia pachydermatis]KOS16167.1 cytoplasm protein [Malassezia pachydermatis]